jgi:molecular chaperone GrpE
MMKKKFRDHEEEKHGNIDNSTENKENSNNNGGQPAEEGSNGNQTDGSSQSDVTTDKMMPEVRAVQEKLAEMQDKYIRLSAEFDNYRKRTLREKMDLSKYAGENLLLGIIPLMDDFDRARAHMDSTADCNGLRDGIDLIYGKFNDFLKQNGVKEIDSINNNFDVDIHEAVAKVPVDEAEKKGKVIDVVQKGYYLQDKVLRFSKVVVGE